MINSHSTLKVANELFINILYHVDSLALTISKQLNCCMPIFPHMQRTNNIRMFFFLELPALCNDGLVPIKVVVDSQDPVQEPYGPLPKVDRMVGNPVDDVLFVYLEG